MLIGIADCRTKAHSEFAERAALFIFTAIMSCLLAACMPGDRTTSAASALVPQPPNIVMILADDLGYSDLSAYGSEIPTPNLDALMERGVQLTNFHSSPVCSPTRAMLLTGQDNHRVGLGTMAEAQVPSLRGVAGYEGTLSIDARTLPEVLRKSGYRTVMAGKWHLGGTAAQIPASRGFDRSFALLGGAAGHFDQTGGFFMKPKADYREDSKTVDLPDNFGFSSDFFTRKAIEYIVETPAKQPVFAYLSFTAPHWPLQAPDEYIARFKGRYDKGYETIRRARLQRMKAKGIVAADVEPNGDPQPWPRWSELSPESRAREARSMEIYAAMVANLDDNIGRLIEALKSHGRYENTIVLFMSDNGPEGSVAEDYGDKNRDWVRKNFDNSLANMGRSGSFIGYGPNWARVSATPFRMFKGHSYEGGTRVPAFISGPSLRPGARSTTYANVKDIAPTLIAAAGGNPSVLGLGPDAKDLLALLRRGPDRRRAAERRNCMELFGRVAVRQGRFKLTFDDKPWGKRDWELFDLSADPAERNDLAASLPGRVAVMKQQWNACRAYNGISWTPNLIDEFRFKASTYHFAN